MNEWYRRVGGNERGVVDIYSWLDNLGHQFHGGGESDSDFVAGDGVDVSHGDSSP